MRAKLAAALLAATTTCAIGVPAALAGGKPFTVNLTGATEVPGPGDPDGSGVARVTLNQGRGQVCVTFRAVTGIAGIAAAHIHEAPAGEAGPVVVPLDPDGGCTTASKALVKEIRKDPEQYYVNVHNAEFPAGALRGQLR